MTIEAEMRALHRKAWRMGFAHYIRKGVVPPIIVEVMVATQSLEALRQHVMAEGKYSPDQPRVPAGNPDGGQWTSGGGSDSKPLQMVQEEVPPGIDLPPEPLPGMTGGRPLPTNPDDLLDQGYEEITHPNEAASGHRTFRNPETGDTLRFDEGDPDEQGYGAEDHYHRYNPNNTSRRDRYLDENGNPVRKGAPSSHLFPREVT